MIFVHSECFFVCFAVMNSCNSVPLFNLSLALSCSLSLSAQINQTGRGSSCSQAIMLVTDGATEMHDDVFAKYNLPDRKVKLEIVLKSRKTI